MWLVRIILCGAIALASAGWFARDSRVVYEPVSMSQEDGPPVTVYSKPRATVVTFGGLKSLYK